MNTPASARALEHGTRASIIVRHHYCMPFLFQSLLREVLDTGRCRRFGGCRLDDKVDS